MIGQDAQGTLPKEQDTYEQTVMELTVFNLMLEETVTRLKRDDARRRRLSKGGRRCDSTISNLEMDTRTATGQMFNVTRRVWTPSIAQSLKTEHEPMEPVSQAGAVVGSCHDHQPGSGVPASSRGSLPSFFPRCDVSFFSSAVHGGHLPRSVSRPAPTLKSALSQSPVNTLIAPPRRRLCASFCFRPRPLALDTSSVYATEPSSPVGDRSSPRSHVVEFSRFPHGRAVNPAVVRQPSGFPESATAAQIARSPLSPQRSSIVSVAGARGALAVVQMLPREQLSICSTDEPSLETGLLRH
ncbi:hypothetical protein DPEC_G00364640 [Dallia pectoralis]|nr:hypothetical protein DPEC_G00364640 [Dallia pectoralis]